MTAPGWLEIPMFIHGITLEDEVRGHGPEYDGLLDLVNQALGRAGKPCFVEPALKVEWGWDAGQSNESDRFLAEAERTIAARVLAAGNSVRDPTINPVRLARSPLRRAFLLGFADLFYYVSQDGEAAVRRHIFSLVNRQIENIRQKTAAGVSLTLIAHSAGTVIAHDLLYHLYRRDSTGDCPFEMQEVRALIRDGRFRVRRLYTMGSPIAPLIVRADSLLMKVLEDEPLDPEEIGLRRSDGLGNPRWVNFWDKDDVLSFPVSFLYKRAATGEEAVRDVHLDLGDLFPLVHSRYWHCRALAEEIAGTF